MRSLTVLGGGSWGTALSIVLAPRFERVRLWVFEQELAERMRVWRENDVYLPGVKLPANIEPVCTLAGAAEGADIVLGVMPSHHARRVYTELGPSLRADMLFVSATKGLEQGTLFRVSEVLHDSLSDRFTPRIGVLSGPNFAKEVARGEPTATVIASSDAELARAVQVAFSGPTFRLYRNSDPVGVELGAALKNVIAIAAGVSAGLGLGANTLAALITRGLAEITRLAVASGGQSRTLSGLAGLGDLVLTCHGELSRNRSVGFQLGQGKALGDILGGMKMVAEGVQTTYAACDLARRLGVEMPISSQMRAILEGTRSPREALRELMERSLRDE